MVDNGNEIKEVTSELGVEPPLVVDLLNSPKMKSRVVRSDDDKGRVIEIFLNDSGKEGEEVCSLRLKDIESAAQKGLCFDNGKYSLAVASIPKQDGNFTDNGKVELKFGPDYFDWLMKVADPYKIGGRLTPEFFEEVLKRSYGEERGSVVMLRYSPLGIKVNRGDGKVSFSHRESIFSPKNDLAEFELADVKRAIESNKAFTKDGVGGEYILFPVVVWRKEGNKKSRVVKFLVLGREKYNELVKKTKKA